MIRELSILIFTVLIDLMISMRMSLSSRMAASYLAQGEHDYE